MVYLDLTHQRGFGTVDFLPHQNSKVCPRQEAAKDVADFVM